MPAFNGRGPWGGSGPGTGWGMGPCGAGMRRGRGFRQGGFGFGAGRMAPWGATPYAAQYPGMYPPMDPADEKAALEYEMNALEAQMKETRERLDRIEKNS